MPRKACFEGDCFQKNREAEQRRAALVGEQFAFVRVESPMVCRSSLVHSRFIVHHPVRIDGGAA
jgi:hypothetical protein